MERGKRKCRHLRTYIQKEKVIFRGRFASKQTSIWTMPSAHVDGAIGDQRGKRKCIHKRMDVQTDKVICRLRSGQCYKCGVIERSQKGWTGSVKKMLNISE